eukprot:939930-Pyramimonas_sp.AAC.1
MRRPSSCGYTQARQRCPRVCGYPRALQHAGLRSAIQSGQNPSRTAKQSRTTEPLPNEKGYFFRAPTVLTDGAGTYLLLLQPVRELAKHAVRQLAAILERCLGSHVQGGAVLGAIQLILAGASGLIYAAGRGL